jgi:hypothetical protein
MYVYVSDITGQKTCKKRRRRKECIFIFQFLRSKLEIKSNAKWFRCLDEIFV